MPKTTSPKSNEVILWPSMKRHLISAGVTFVATFLTIFGANLALADSMEITGAALASIAIVAVRAAVKAVVEGLSH